MAKRAWDEGYTDTLTWARPIKEVLLEEQQKARAQEAAEAESRLKVSAELRAKAAQDSIDSLAAEGQMLKVGRSSVTSALAAAGIMWPALKKLAEHMRMEIESAPEKITVKQGLAFMRTYAYICSLGTGAAKALIEAERIKKGEPTQVLGIQVEALSLEEAVGELSHVHELISQARDQGLIPGGGAGQIIDVGEGPAGPNGGNGRAVH